MKSKLVTTSILLALFCHTSGQTTPQLGKSTNAQVIAAMTLEEKAGLLVGMGMTFPGMPSIPALKGPGSVGEKRDVPGAAGTTASIPRLGIPTLVLADGPAGLRIEPIRTNDDWTYYATAFPIATLMASTWDTDLVQRVGASMGNEVKEYGVDILLAPGMNIHRNALGGRNFEYYSEDPLLTGKMAAAMVRGVQANGVGTSIKHFAANNSESNRMTLNVKVGERALREIYLRGFEIAVKEGKPWTVMSSYNLINGKYTSESGYLLQDILRNDWGFEGVVITDWFGGSNPVEQMKAGNNLIMPGLQSQKSAIIEAVKSGKLDEKILDRNVDEMLNLIRLSPVFIKYSPSNRPNLEENALTAREAASEGMVLLKNSDRALPLKKNSSIAAFGNGSYGLVSGGTGSGDVNEAYTVSLVEGLSSAAYQYHTTLKSAYEKYLTEEKAKQPAIRPFLMPERLIPERKIERKELDASSSADIAVITISRTSGEFADRSKEGGFDLTATERELISDVSEVFHAKGKKVVVVLNTGGVVETASWRNEVDAVLLAWLPGQEAGNAIADIVSGKVNPSGKLPTTFSTSYEDDPTSDGFPGRATGDEIDFIFIKTRPAEIEYDEGIFVGYRAFDKKDIKPAYEFGFGLSYTKFEYSNLALSSDKFNGEMIVSVSVKNTGKVAGKEIVQLYLSAPASLLEKPVRELKGFAKTRLLRPNESLVLTMKLDARALASFSEERSTWLAEKGVYEVRIGASSRDIRLTSKFTLDQTLILDK